MADANANPAGGQPADAGQGPQNLKVNLPDASRAGHYSNAVSVNVNSNEVVVDFGYLLPNTTDPEIEVVSRVNMNHKTAQSFIDVLSGAMKDFEAKQAQQNTGQAPAAPATTAPVAAPAPAPAPMPAPAPAAPAAPAAPMPPAPPAPPAAPAAPTPTPPMPPLPPNA